MNNQAQKMTEQSHVYKLKLMNAELRDKVDAFEKDNLGKIT